MEYRANCSVFGENDRELSLEGLYQVASLQAHCLAIRLGSGAVNQRPDA